MKSLTIKLPAGLHAWLDAECKRSGRSKSELMREALQQRRKTGRKQSALDLAGDLCGIGNSGLGDLSTNQKYLKNFGK